MSEFKPIGQVIRIEWDTEDNSLRLVMDITDQSFKAKILNDKSLKDIITIKGKDVMVVASKSKKAEE